MIVIEGASKPRYDHLVTRFNLERMVLQVGILVNRSRYIARLEDLGLTDGLTGLPNRRALTARLKDAQQVSRRRGDHLALAMLDLDEFKAFNDSFGHLAGDDLLRTFATQLRARLRGVDFVARYGGEEFCVVLPSADAAGAERLLDELHERLREGDAGRVTFSAGVAVWDGEESSEVPVGSRRPGPVRGEGRRSRLHGRRPARFLKSTAGNRRPASDRARACGRIGAVPFTRPSTDAGSSTEPPLDPRPANVP